jgi:hypothetical protein
MANTTNQGQATRDKVKDTVSSAAEKTKDAAHTAVDRASDYASQAADKAGDFASRAADKASSLASQAADKARDFASAAGDKADSATSSVGHGMRTAAEGLRERLPSEGMLGAASSSVADTLESGGRYLEEKGLSGVAEDMTGLIRRNPIPAVLIALGLGFLLARATRS